MSEYLTRDEIAQYVGQTVTIRRHFSPRGGRVSVISGVLLRVGRYSERFGVLPGTLRDERGDSAVDLACVLDIRAEVQNAARGGMTG